jgi:hypothetical protein
MTEFVSSAYAQRRACGVSGTCVERSWRRLGKSGQAPASFRTEAGHSAWVLARMRFATQRLTDTPAAFAAAFMRALVSPSM